MYEADWAQPNPSDLTDPAGPPLPDEERLVTEGLPATDVGLAELGAFYPIVAYPEPQDQEAPDDQLDRTIYAGLINS